MIFEASDWKISGSSGGTVTGGTPILKIQFGGSFLKLPLTNTKSNELHSIRGFGVGGAGGINAEMPWSDILNISGSTEDFTSNGLGIIYRRQADKSYTINDLTGIITVGSAGVVGSGNGVTIAVALWQSAEFKCDSTTFTCKLIRSISENAIRINPAAIPMSLLVNTNAIGLFYGHSLASDFAQVGASAFTYNMV